MLARVSSFVLSGIDAHPCEVEVDVDETDLQKSTVVGLPDAAVKESLERVRSAILNQGYPFPQGRILVNLAPADVRKEGPVYDLPIALALLEASGVLGARPAGLDLRQHLVAGELALDGRVRPIRGAIAAADLARRKQLRGIILPAGNTREAAVVPGLEAVGVSTLSEIVGAITGAIDAEPAPPIDIASRIEHAEADIDFAEVKGQESVKRALVVAAAGHHNIVMLGPAGTGKTMMARALPGIMPPLTPDEAVEVTRVWSAVGALPADAGLIASRPVRSPHHTASAAAVIGGGIIPRPGEISLAHRGVLFLDELPEFPRHVLDTLRQPLEEGSVIVSRARQTVRFPADFMLIAAMNPTAKGDMPTTAAGRREMERYLSRVSRPLLDRIDIHIEAPAVPWAELSGAAVGSTSAQMREHVERARAVQRSRQGERTNARLRGKDLDTLAPLEQDAETLLGQAITELGLSARAYDKVRRIARTIADLDGSEAVTAAAVAEAVQYRLLDRALV